MEIGWHKNSVIYGINVSTFQDSNGDGIGDFRGITNRLDYLSDLGVNCLWLLPFYPSPRRDNGYDVSNYLGVDPQYGSLDDFRELVDEAKARGIGIIIDLVVHHTSDQHPWFESARSDRRSSYRDYYIWSDTLPDTPAEESFFPEVESGVWRYDSLSKSYYHHGFYHFQPDLNFANQRVRDEVFAIVDFWLSFGISGFRLDAAPLIIGRKGLPTTEVVDPGAFWREIRAFLDQRQPEAFLLAEADIDLKDINEYVLDGQGIHALLNFWSNQTMWYALATADKRPLMKTLNDLPALPEGSQYVNFLRNLDELNVKLFSGQLSDKEQKDIYKQFGPTKNMQVYGRGIRRRLAPMLGNLPQLKMALSLMFAMPGVPMFVYGDEIGMGDNLDLEERDSVRTPMQWSDEPNGGFSKAGSSKFLDRTIKDPHYQFKALNVARELGDDESVLEFVKRLIELRLAYPLLATSPFYAPESDHNNIIVLSYRHDDDVLVAIHNLDSQACAFKLDEAGELDDLKEVFSDRDYPEVSAGEPVEIGGYGLRWFAR